MLIFSYAVDVDSSRRVWNIVVEECFAFSTRERAPLFITLEVVDYIPPNTFRYLSVCRMQFSIRKLLLICVLPCVSSDGVGRKWGIPDLGIKKSIKRAIDTFGDSAGIGDDEGNEFSGPSSRPASELPMSSSMSTQSTLGTSQTRTTKPMLGDRVLSAPLLSDLLLPEIDEDASTRSIENAYTKYQAGDDIEAPAATEELLSTRGGRANRGRAASLPSHESDVFNLPDDEIGQWALPSIPKKILDKRPTEPPKLGFKQGLTRYHTVYYLPFLVVERC